MRHIAQTLIRKEAIEKAKEPSVSKYWKKVRQAQAMGYLPEEIIKELESEKERIIADVREGDPFFQSGLENSKISCLNALTLIISDLKGETNVLYK